VVPILPWVAHLYTATGAVIALLAASLLLAALDVFRVVDVRGLASRLFGR